MPIENDIDAFEELDIEIGGDAVPPFRVEYVNIKPTCSYNDYYDRKVVCISCKKVLQENDTYASYFNSRKIDDRGKLQVICSACVSNSDFKQCESCLSYYEDNILERGDCQTCIAEATARHILNYKYRVEKDLGMRGQEPKDRIYYGIELELESKNIGLDVLIVNSLIKEIAKLKKDASIKHGFEIVSAPATIDEHYYMWDNFFEKLPPTCEPLHSCGMHVHVTRDRLSELQIGKMLMFLHAKENREFIKVVAGRDSNFHNNFTTEKRYKDVRIPLVDKDGRPDHHTALNLHKENTIEFRIFWSTRDRRIFLKNIEFCKAITKFADWATNSLCDSVNYMKFVGFVQTNRKEYPYLSLFFEMPSVKALIGA